MHHQDAGRASFIVTGEPPPDYGSREMYTPELNASEQKRMAGSYNGHNDAGGGGVGDSFFSQGMGGGGFDPFGGMGGGFGSPPRRASARRATTR